MKRFFTISICLLLLLSNRFVKAQTCHAGIITALRDTSCAGIPDQLTVTGSSGNIQWQSANNDTFANVINAADTSLKTKPLLKTTYFRVVASNGTCTDTSAVYRVFVSDVIYTEFTGTTAGNNTVSFNSDSSKGNIVSYHWYFGDGDTSNEPNPVHTYMKDSTFYVCLTLYDGSDCSYTFCRYIENFGDGGCSPSFGYSVKGDTVYFYINEQFEATYGWAIGNGNWIEGANQSSIFVFNSQGTYSVCLIMMDYENNCTGQTCEDISVGIETVFPKLQTLVVYPNPCTDCEIKGVQNPNELLITDLLGRVIPVSFSKQSNGYRLNFPFAGTGMYLIKNVRTGEVVKFVSE